MYCPRCKTKVLINIVLTLPVDYAQITDINKLVLSPTTILTSFLKSRNSVENQVVGLKCPSCGNTFTEDAFMKLLVVSELTDRYLSVETARIIYEKASDNETTDNKIKVIRPPRIIGEDEIEHYTSLYKPIQENVVIRKITKLEINNLFQ